jgi:hypothetical protein
MKVKSGLVIEALPEGGSLVVDESSQQSHALAPEAARVLRSVEQGLGDVAAIARETSLEPSLVEAALGELARVGLIEEEAGSSRREWLARAAAVAGAAVGLKLVETIATPSPASAQSLVDGDEQDGDT